MNQVFQHIMKGLFFSALMFILLSGCKKKHPQPLQKAFYYWKTSFHLTKYEQRRLDSFGAKTLYVRFFDVSWNNEANEPRPIAVSRINKDRPEKYNYIPVIFFTQEVMSQISMGNLPDFARNLTRLLDEKCFQSHIQPKEMQIDCDWTRSTQQKYFQFLTQCKKQSFFKDKKLSCTIRLHQLRYVQFSGIPPVDKGLLMCYNMGNLKLAGENNSILDLRVARKYLTHLKDYPLNLDIALPLFSWSLLYDDKNRFTGIVRDLTEKELKSTGLFESVGPNLYRVKIDTVWNGYHLKKTATIRHESCSPEQLDQLAQFIKGKTRHISTLIFYHLDSLTLTKYSNNELEKIYHTVL